jgi:thiol:disulfide interchange protein DsbC
MMETLSVPFARRRPGLVPVFSLVPLAALCAVLLGLPPAAAREETIRRNLTERLPNLPRIDEVRATPVPGIWEVRVGTDILYSDDQGRFVFTGELLDTREQVNLTQERIDKLTAIDFSKLPLKDAIAVRQGNGQRRLAVFVDPNCGYCKRFERDLAGLKDVTIYNFLYPILGRDSTERSRNIWCAKDPAKAWRDWMLSNVSPPAADPKCDASALERNVALGRQHRIQGTPAAIFVDGTRAPGAIPAAEIEKRLTAAGKG